MFVEDSYKLGELYKAYGIKGELIIRTDLKLSENTITNWESIFIKINGILVPFFVDNIFLKSEKEIQIKLEDICDEIQAKKYIGYEIYLDQETSFIEDENSVFFKYINFQIANDQSEKLGQIVDLLEYPGQIMLVVNNLEGDEIIVPAIEDWIVSVDSDQKIISMNLPDGLLDLNLKDDLF